MTENNVINTVLFVLATIGVIAILYVLVTSFGGVTKNYTEHYSISLVANNKVFYTAVPVNRDLLPQNANMIFIVNRSVNALPASYTDLCIGDVFIPVSYPDFTEVISFSDNEGNGPWYVFQVVEKVYSDDGNHILYAICPVRSVVPGYN